MVVQIIFLLSIIVSVLILLFALQTFRSSKNKEEVNNKGLNLDSKKADELTDSNWVRMLNNFMSMLKNFKFQSVTSIATLLIGISSLFVAYNQYESSIQMQELQNKLYQTEINMVEGQLVASLLTSLIQGSEAEREMALLILTSKAPNMATLVLPIISERDPSPQVRRLATQEFKNLKFSNLLKDARIFLELKRYKTAAQYFKDAVEFVDTSNLNKSLLEVAISRYNANSDSLAATLFQEVFKDYK